MACEHCDDTGWKPIDDPTTGVRRVVRCDCWRDKLTKNSFASSNIPKRYLHCTLDNLRPYNQSLEDAVTKARRFVEGFPGKIDRGLLLVGHAGVGKTHIAVGMLRGIIEKTGIHGLFYDTRDLLT